MSCDTGSFIFLDAFSVGGLEEIGCTTPVLADDRFGRRTEVTSERRGEVEVANEWKHNTLLPSPIAKRVNATDGMRIPRKEKEAMLNPPVKPMPVQQGEIGYRK